MRTVGSLLLGCLLVFVLAFPAGAEPLLRVVSDRWMPFNGEPNSQSEGYAVEILRAIFEPKGWKVDYREQPWKRALADVREGRADVAIGATDYEAPDFIYPKTSLAVLRLCFYTTKTGWQYEGPKSLADMKVGVVQGYGYPPDVLEMIMSSSGTVTSVPGQDAFPRMVDMLAQDRINVLLSNQVVMEHYIKEKGLDTLVFFAGYPRDEFTKMFYGLSPANPSKSQLIADAIDKGMELMRKTGQLNHLLLKYGLKDWYKNK